MRKRLAADVFIYVNKENQEEQKNYAIYQNRADRLPGREGSMSNNKMKTLCQNQ